MKIGVIGAGAVGIAITSSLLEAGAEVQLVARSPVGEALRSRGLRRIGLFGEFRASAQDFDVVDRPSQLAAPRFILVCTKTFDSTEIARELAARRDSDTWVVLFHNGWGSAEIFAAELGRRWIGSARVITGFRKTDETTSEVTVHADAIHLGTLFTKDPAPLRPLADLLQRGRMPCRISEDIAGDLWAKLLYNCALNPLGALLQVPYGALAASEPTRSILRRVVQEAFAVMGAEGYRTQWPDPDSYLSDFYSSILPPTAAHESSMLQDLRSGRRTEIDALSGAVAEMGARHGVSTPVNSALRQLIRAIEARSSSSPPRTA